jgi:hypothetical protein
LLPELLERLDAACTSDSAGGISVRVRLNMWPTVERNIAIREVNAASDFLPA